MLKFNFDKFKTQQQIQLMSLLNNPYTLTLREEKGSKLTIQELDDNFRYFLNNISGTANQVVYFDANGNISSDQFFTRTDETTTIGTSWWTPNYLQFTGSGLNDGVLLVPTNGYYTGPTNSVYTITISATGSPADFFDWSSTSGASGSNVQIVNGGNQLDSEIGVYFPSTTGYTIGDSWESGMIQMTSFHVNGSLFFETGWNGTYSTGEGQIVTVTNGIITNVA